MAPSPYTSERSSTVRGLAPRLLRRHEPHGPDDRSAPVTGEFSHGRVGVASDRRLTATERLSTERLSTDDCRLSTAFTTPQSITITSPNAPTITFSGLRSRWMKPLRVRKGDRLADAFEEAQPFGEVRARREA